ncbi:MAG TPA: hypothetical protein ENK84_11650 [Desulfobulbus sp.]|nr:hypothetical protein [Desulfobulbus sp.]
MEPIQQAPAPDNAVQNPSGIDASHQYTTIPGSAPPPQAPAPSYPQYAAQTPAKATTAATSQALAVGMLGLIIVGTGTMGANLHKVQDGDMAMGEAVNNSLIKGAAGGLAAASATAASSTLTSGGITGLVVTLATATGVSYLLSNG